MEMISSSAGAPGYRPTRLPTALYGGGMLAVYMGERIVESGKASVTFTVLGLALAVAAVALRLLRLRRVAAAHRAAERSLLVLYVVGLVALGLYFLNSTLFWRMTGRTLEQAMPRLGPIVATLWPALWLCAALPIVFVELSLGAMARAPVLEAGRVRAALLSALGLAFALIFVFTATYVSSERNVKWDLSYFRMARAGESTKKIVQALDQPVTIALFFPPANEVKEEVETYLADLTRLSKQLRIENYDQALHPAKARELGVSGNGTVVIARDSLKEQIALNLRLEGARSQLRSLDHELNKRLLAVTRKPRVAYFTRGHDERSFEPAGDGDKRATIAGLRTLLVEQRFEVKELGLAQGLGNEIPQDATVIFIVGPKKPFLPEETAALKKYLDRQGRLFIALDPEHGVTLSELLAELALTYHPVQLGHETFVWQRAHEESDRANIASNSFSSHVSVSTISRAGRRGAVVFPVAGHLEKNEKGAVGIVNVDFTVHSDANTFADKNADFRGGDPSVEPRRVYELAAAVNKRNASALQPEEEARAIVVADSDVVADEIWRNLGNQYFAYDGVRWLGGEERFTGTINNEEDVPIVHTRKQDTIWFYSSIFAAPSVVLALGFALNRRGRRGRILTAKEKAETAAGGGTPPEVQR